MVINFNNHVFIVIISSMFKKLFKQKTEVKNETLVILVILSLVFSFMSLLFAIKGYVKNDYKRYHDKYIAEMTLQMHEAKMSSKKITDRMKSKKEATTSTAKLENFVNKGIRIYQSVGGLESFLNLVNDPEGIFNNDLTHLFVIKEDSDMTIGNAGYPETIGTDMIDDSGSLNRMIADKATEGGAWIKSGWRQEMYVVLFDNLIFGAVYDPKKNSGQGRQIRW